VSYGDGQSQGYVFDALVNRFSKSETTNGTTVSESYSYNAANMLLSRGGRSKARRSAPLSSGTLPWSLVRYSYEKLRGW
jgi:hypothetical protein